MHFEKLILPLIASIVSFSFASCKKELVESKLLLNIGKTPSTAQLVNTFCNDTSAFKSENDLLALTYLEDCYLATATKEVPGLGTANWTMNSSAIYGNLWLTFTFETYQAWGEIMVLRETVVCGVPHEIGFHEVLGGHYDRALSDGDVFGTLWVYDTTCTSYVNVKQLDLECGEVRGEFELHFIMDENKAPFPLSDRVNFINGKFEARIKQY